MVAMRVDGPTNTSVPGGQVPYQVAVDNRGSVPIQGVHVQIVQVDGGDRETACRYAAPSQSCAVPPSPVSPPSSTLCILGRGAGC